MNTRIVIAGAGGFGRGVFGWLAGSPVHRKAFGIEDVVFIDDSAPLVTPQAPVISTIDDYQPKPNDRLICAMGVPAIRRTVVGRLQARGVTFHTFVDDRAIIGSRVRISKGVVICPGVVVSVDAVIHDHVHINFNCSVGHDTVLGAFSTLSPAVNIMGQVKVGESVFFGGSSVVLPRLTVGANAVIAAGGVATKSTPSNAIIVGNPARITPRKGGS